MPTPLLGGSEIAIPPSLSAHPPEKVVLISGEVVDGHPYAARRGSTGVISPNGVTNQFWNPGLLRWFRRQIVEAPMAERARPPSFLSEGRVIWTDYCALIGGQSDFLALPRDLIWGLIDNPEGNFCEVPPPVLLAHIV